MVRGVRGLRVGGRVVIAAILVIWLVAGFVNFGGGLHLSGQATATLDEYGGDNDIALADTSGYFRTAQVAGRWWLVTPAAHAFYSLGVDSISATQGISLSNGYAQAVLHDYADTNAWGAAAAARVQSWGFNTIGAWSSPQVEHHGVAHTRTLHLVADMPSRVNWVFPNVFDPAWPQHLQDRVNALISDADVRDPWLVGWYLDNELWWYQDGVYVDRPNNTVVENYIAQPPTSTAKLAWVSYLEGRYNDIAALNRVWGTAYSSFRGDAPDSLLQTAQVTATGATADKMGFLALVSDRFFSTTSAAVRARDPNHLILGVRFLPQPALQPIIVGEAPYVDVVTANLYNKDFDNPDLSELDRMAAWSNKPLIITEFTARAEDAGMPNGFTAPGRTVPSQQARADAYRIFLDQLLQRPYIVGAHWYSYADDPPLGSRIEQSNNWGLVNNLDQPYSALTSRVTLYNRNIYAARIGVPDPGLSIPSPITPAFDAPIFAARIKLFWSEVATANGYIVQLARNPQFAGAVSYTTSLPTYTITSTQAGRWYWRVRVNNGLSDDLAYTSPWPFYVYSVAGARPLTAADWPWQPAATNAITPTATGLQFSGATDPNSSYATINGPLNGNVSDWRNYDFLSLVITNTSAAPEHILIGLGESAASKSFAWFATLPPGASHLTERIIEATQRDEPSRHLDLDKLTSLTIGLRLPQAHQSLQHGEAQLISANHDSVNQPPITQMTEAPNLSGTVALDWRSYQAATSTVAYAIYASAQPISAADTATLTPTLTLDAAAQQSLVRVYREADGTLKPMQAAQQYYFIVMPLDVWQRK